MRVPFVKMSGAGNDMILIDHREGALRGRESEFARLTCDPKSGPGADGTLLVETDALGIRVRFFNPDGGEYGLCGNGARCVPEFLSEIGIPGPEYAFRSDSGEHRASVTTPGRAKVSLAPVRETRLAISCAQLGLPVQEMDWGDIGVPHASVWVEAVSKVPVLEWAPVLRNHPSFAPEGTNVSFVEVHGPDRLRIRTFERGVEGETLACGSGSAVAATIARERGFVTGQAVELEVRSGDRLTIEFGSEKGAAPLLEGPVTRALEGTLEFPDA